MSARKIVYNDTLPSFKISAALVLISIAIPAGCENKALSKPQSVKRLDVEMKSVETTLDVFLDILIDRLETNGVEAKSTGGNGDYREFSIIVRSKELDNDKQIRIVTDNFKELNLSCDENFSLTVPSIAFLSEDMRVFDANYWGISAAKARLDQNASKDTISIDTEAGSANEPEIERYLEFGLFKKR